MEDDDRPRDRGDIAGKLATESLDPYSHDELIERIRLLELEISRTRTHMERGQAHRKAADALFRSSS